MQNKPSLHLTKEEKIVFYYTKKYYPRGNEDMEARHRAIAMIAEILRDLKQNEEKSF